MKVSLLALVLGTVLVAAPGTSAFAEVASAPATAPSAVNPARRTARQVQIKAIRADIQAIRAAHKSRDKAAVQTGAAKLKTDWQGLPPKVRHRIRAKHPALFQHLRKDMTRPAHHKAKAVPQ